MKKDSFNLRPDDEFIPLLSLLKFMNIAQTGGHAKILVKAGDVKVNGEVEFRKRRKLRPGDIVECENFSIEIRG